MKYINLRNTDLKLSNICLGGGSFGGTIPEAAAFDLLDAFTEAGGNFIDTAAVYCRWLPGVGNCSEEIIGKWLKSRNAYDKTVIATKGGHYDFKIKDVSRVRREEIAKDIEDSLRTLGLERIDMYWLHRDDETIPIEEIIGWMEGFVSQGKIRYYGASNFNLDRMKKAPQGFCAVSNRWSLAVRSGELSDPTMAEMSDAFYNWHRETKMPSIPYSSTAAGFFEKLYKLNPRIDNGRVIAPSLETVTDARISRAFLNDENLDMYIKLLEEKEKYNVSLYTLSVAHMLNHSFDVIPIGSVNSLGQLAEFIKAGELEV